MAASNVPETNVCLWSPCFSGCCRSYSTAAICVVAASAAAHPAPDHDVASCVIAAVAAAVEMSGADPDCATGEGQLFLECLRIHRTQVRSLRIEGRARKESGRGLGSGLDEVLPSKNV